MPTFNEDVTVNGVIRISRQGDGTVLLDLLSERSWEFRQLRSGQDTALELVNIGGGGNKSLIISTTGQVGIGTQSPQATLGLNASRNPQLPADFPGMRITRQGNGVVLLHLATERPWDSASGEAARARLSNLPALGSVAATRI